MPELVGLVDQRYIFFEFGKNAIDALLMGAGSSLSQSGSRSTTMAFPAARTKTTTVPNVEHVRLHALIMLQRKDLVYLCYTFCNA